MKSSVRMCSVCRSRLPKEQLIRFVKTKDGSVYMEKKQKIFGRGAYICKNEKCLSIARKKKCLERSFGCQVSKELYERMM